MVWVTYAGHEDEICLPGDVGDHSGRNHDNREHLHGSWVSNVLVPGMAKRGLLQRSNSSTQPGTSPWLGPGEG